MAREIIKKYACDFETTVYDGQVTTEVWSAAMAPLDDENDTVFVYHSLPEMFKAIKRLHTNLILYFHNLKFDGEFILYYIINTLHLELAHEEGIGFHKKLKNNQYRYMISSRGQFYKIELCLGTKKIEIRDSFKLLPYSLRSIGPAFNTKHRKLDMEYKGFRYAGCTISDKELSYIKNDVLVLKEALNSIFSDGHTKLTIGSCCLDEFKKCRSYDSSLYPDVYSDSLPLDCMYKTMGDYIQKSYFGGWCYLVPEKANKVLHGGCTVDANSLYPSEMHSASGNRYPVGHGKYFKGLPPKGIALPEYYYFLRFKCCFRIKPGYLPFIQIKNNPLYRGNEMLTTSDIYSHRAQKYYHWYYDEEGNKKESTVELCLTCVDYERFKEHYQIYNFEPLDGIFFSTAIGIFDEYINHYAHQKMTSKGAKRTEAKLFLNNLYGKMAANTDSSYKLAFMDKDILRYTTIIENKKKPGYIPIGSAITSYARDRTIRNAQKNYHPGKPGFCYADTDSLHCDFPKEHLQGIPIHDSKFCYWKVEEEWHTAWFTRQKTYIEVTDKFDLSVSIDDYELLDNYGICIRCAGMPEVSKKHFVRGLQGDMSGVVRPRADKLSLSDFRPGLELHGKLLPKRYPGGIVLEDTNYKMRDIVFKNNEQFLE